MTHAFIVINARNDPQAIQYISAGHDQIINALIRHDLATAVEILTKHLEEAEDSMLAVKAKLPGSAG